MRTASSHDLYARSTTYATWAMAGVTAATLAVLVFHGCELRNATRAARQSATAAENAVQSTRENMRLDQRAWVGIDSIQSIPRSPEVGKPIQIIVKIRNTGKTPALGVVGTAVADPVAKNSQPNYSYEGMDHFRLGVMPPNATGTIPIHPSKHPQTGIVLPLSQGKFDEISNGRLQIFVHGRVEYKDIFQAPHWFTFCARLNVPFDERFGACADHNETDDYQGEHQHQTSQRR